MDHQRLDLIHDRILEELSRVHSELSRVEEVVLKQKLLDLVRAKIDDPDELERRFQELVPHGRPPRGPDYSSGRSGGMGA